MTPTPNQQSKRKETDTVKLKLATKASIKKAIASLEGAASNFASAIVALAKKEVESGADAGAVVLAFLGECVKGSWAAQEMARALKSDADLLAAGLKVKAFRNSKPAPKKGNRKAKKAAAPGKGGAQREGALARALKARDAAKFAAAIAAELGEEALAFAEAVYAALEA